MSKAKLVLFLVVVVSLSLAAPGRASEPCSGVTGAASESAAFLATLQSPQALTPAPAETIDRPAGDVVLKANFCTKEVCSVARQECRAWCPFPCTMTFECVFPSCGSCISCSC